MESRVNGLLGAKSKKGQKEGVAGKPDMECERATERERKEGVLENM